MKDSSTTRNASEAHEIEQSAVAVELADAIQPDLFAVDTVSDWPVKDDVSSMEYPIFSLSKNHDTRIRHYSRGGKVVRVIPSAYGAATVFDKDILIYCISQIVKALEKVVKELESGDIELPRLTANQFDAIARNINMSSHMRELAHGVLVAGRPLDEVAAQFETTRHRVCVAVAHAIGRVSRRVRIDVHPFLVGTRRSTGGAAYERVVDMSRRLKGTTIETNVKTTEEEGTEGFGLIEDYRVTTWTKNEKGALQLEMTISEWLYRAATEFDILTLHPDYFSLGQALERRLYELARKHCGDKAWWEINLPLLQEKTGSAQTARRFKQDLKDIVARDTLPDYRIGLDESVRPNKVVFITRDNAKLLLEANRQGRLSWISQFLQQKLA